MALCNLRSTFLWLVFHYTICNGYHCDVQSSDNKQNSDGRLLSGYNDPLGPTTQVSYFDSALSLAASKLFPATLRHPGGTTANYWSLKNASFVTPCNTSYYNYCSQQNKIEQFPNQTFSPSNFSNGIATDSLINADKNNGHTIVFDMNVYTLNGDQLLEQFDYINYQHLNNSNAIYYELGNELYYGKYSNLIPNSTYYMQKVIPLINKIKTETHGKGKIAALCFMRLNNVNNEWNLGVAVFNDSYDSVTIHDYSCGIDNVQQLSPENQISYISIYGQSVIPQYIDHVQEIFGNKNIWITEFNLGLNQHAFNATIQASVVHAMFVISYITASICHSDTMELLMYHTWTSSDFSADHQLFQVKNTPPNDVKDARFGIMGQIYAQLSWISMIKNDQMHCLTVSGSNGNCPNLHISVQNKTELRCVYGAAFSNSSDQNSFGFVLQNSCTFEISITLYLDKIANITSNDIKLNKWKYSWNQIGAPPYYTKFEDCQNNYVWQCGPVTPNHTIQIVEKSQNTLNISLQSLSLILAATD